MNYMWAVHLTVIATITGRYHVEAANPPNNDVETCVYNDGVGVRKGFCSIERKCDALISNRNSGILAKLCKYKIDDQKAYCCPSADDERISESKCTQYTDIKEEIEKARRKEREYQRFNVSSPVKGSYYFRSSRIVSGRNATRFEFPFMVALSQGDSKDRKYPCGGTLISDKFVLTAAHCVVTRRGKVNSRPIYVLVGGLRLTNPKKLPYHKVAKIHVHGAYNHTLVYHDIALLELEKPVQFKKYQLPACLPSPRERFDQDKVLEALGWGYNRYKGERPDHLQVAMIPRMSDTKCKQTFEDDEKLPKGVRRGQFCAGHEAGDTCTGDSGGPLVAIRQTGRDIVVTQHYVVGVTSYGTVICGSKPGLYVNVQSYLNWIEKIVWGENEDEKIASRINFPLSTRFKPFRFPNREYWF